MKEKTRELVLAIGMATLGFAGLTARSISKDYTNPAIVAAAIGFGYNIFDLWRRWDRSNSITATTQQFPWQSRQPIATHMDVWMCVPRNYHKKGPEPKAEISKGPDFKFVVEPDDEGNIYVYHPHNYFPLNWAHTYLELKIKG